MIIPPQNITLKQVEELLEHASRLGVDVLQISPEGFTRCRNLCWHLKRGTVSSKDYFALLRVVDREEATWTGKFNYLSPFRPAPTQEQIGSWSIRLPFHVMDNGTLLTLQFEHVVRGVTFLGPLGVGKTTAAMHLLMVLKGYRVPFVCFDRKGQECRFLQDHFPVLVLTPGKDLYLDPFMGDLYEDILILSIMLDIFSRKDSQAIGQAALRIFFDELLPRGETLTFRRFVELIPRARPVCWKSFNPGLFQSISAVISSIICSPLGKVFACIRGLDISRMLQQGVSLIIDASNLTTQMEELLICIIAEKIYWAVRNNPRIAGHHGAKACLYIDEASEYISEKADRDQRHLGPLASYFLRARSAGIINMFSCHNPSRVSSVLKSAFHVQLCGHLNSEADKKSVADSMGLDDDQAKALLHLGIGEFCVKLGSGHTTPFLVKADPLDRGIA